jgi:energy-coupling factor transporter transmembrane protein EcfT
MSIPSHFIICFFISQSIYLCILFIFLLLLYLFWFFSSILLKKLITAAVSLLLSVLAHIHISAVYLNTYICLNCYIRARARTHTQRESDPKVTQPINPLLENISPLC